MANPTVPAKTFRVNFGFRGKNNALTQKSLIIDAVDLADAKKTAIAQLTAAYDWYQITKIEAAVSGAIG